MIVGMDRLLAAHLATEDLNGAVRDDLVGVHVRLGAGTGLKDGQREVVDELEVRNFRSCLLNSLAELRIWSP